MATFDDVDARPDGGKERRRPPPEALTPAQAHALLRSAPLAPRYPRREPSDEPKTGGEALPGGHDRRLDAGL